MAQKEIDLSFETIVQTIEEGIVLENGEGVITFVNLKICEMLGYSKEELIGKHWSDIVPSEERSVISTQLSLRKKGMRSQYESFLLHKNGKKIPVIIGSRPIISEEGKFMGAVSAFTDISERRKVEKEIRDKSERLELLNRALNLHRERLLKTAEELEKANQELKTLSQAKSDFVSAVSHDLRNPLTTIIEGINLVEDGTLGEVNPEQKRYLRMVLEDSERLLTFINDLLDLSKIEAGKLTANPVRIEISEIVNKLAKSYEPYLKEKGLEFITKIPEDLPALFADGQHLYRVFTNLLSNAIKFTPEGGTITIESQLDESKSALVISVIDTGKGIPKSEQSRLFKKFEQITSEATRTLKGTGLGLALCRELVELNGGSISVESEENKGSRFYFTVPLYDDLTDLEWAVSRVQKFSQKLNLPLAILLFRVENWQELASRFGLKIFLKVLGDAESLVKNRVFQYDEIRKIGLNKEGDKGVVLISVRSEDGCEEIYNNISDVLRNHQFLSNGKKIPVKWFGSYFINSEVKDPKSVIKMAIRKFLIANNK